MTQLTRMTRPGFNAGAGNAREMHSTYGVLPTFDRKCHVPCGISGKAQDTFTGIGYMMWTSSVCPEYADT